MALAEWESIGLASPAGSKKTEYEYKWHDSLRGKKWQVGRQWDRGCGCFESSGFQPFSVCGHPETYRNRRTLCRQVRNNWMAFLDCLRHTLSQAPQSPTGPWTTGWKPLLYKQKGVLKKAAARKGRNEVQKRHSLSGRRDWIVSLLCLRSAN